MPRNFLGVDLLLICLQALYASTSISTGMKGATKAMVAMNKVCISRGSFDTNLQHYYLLLCTFPSYLITRPSLTMHGLRNIMSQTVHCNSTTRFLIFLSQYFSFQINKVLLSFFFFISANGTCKTS